MTETVMNKSVEYTLSKVPEVTLVFWIIKIVATTLGEIGAAPEFMIFEPGLPGVAFTRMVETGDAAIGYSACS